MKRIITILTILFTAALSSKADGVDSLFVEARGAFHQQLREGYYSSSLRAEHLNLQIFGSISDKLSYRVRQRLNVGIDEKNPFRATDWMCLTWTPTPRIKLYAGKTSVLIGGYEYDSAPIDVYYYSQFCSNLSQYFAFSVNASYEFLPDQWATFQVSNSPISHGFEDIYAYNAAWQGQFFSWWKTIWSVNMIEDYDNQFMNYIALGNHWLIGNVAVDLDLFHRASFQQKRFFFSDYSLISKIIWSINKWNICTKFGYEMNSIDNVGKEGKPYDTVMIPGTEYVYGGAGLEYFPLGNDRLRLHLAWFRDSFDHQDNLELGLKWKFDIIKK